MKYTCPFCGSEDFEAVDWEFFGDTLESYCVCDECGGWFNGNFKVIFEQVVPVKYDKEKK